MSKLIKIGLPILLVAAFFAYKFTQPKAPLDIQTAATELMISATKLYADFEMDEANANSKYAGKVIEVSGTLGEVSKDEGGSYVINLDADSPLGQVVFYLADSSPSPIPSEKIGDSVKLKGVCTGYLFDVVLDNATIITQ